VWVVTEVDNVRNIHQPVSFWYEYGVAQGQARILNRIECTPDRYNYYVTYDETLVNGIDKLELSVIRPQ
jgi:hypothetical protein